MYLEREYDWFKSSSISGVELEKLGNNLVSHVLNHIGMMRYSRSGIKVFDITESEVGKLTDASIKVLKGVTPREGLAKYRVSIGELIESVLNIKGKNKSNVVSDSLKDTFARELQKFTREVIYFDEIWEL